jgi:hypothetical protein
MKKINVSICIATGINLLLLLKLLLNLNVLKKLYHFDNSFKFAGFRKGRNT